MQDAMRASDERIALSAEWLRRESLAWLERNGSDDVVSRAAADLLAPPQLPAAAAPSVSPPITTKRTTRARESHHQQHARATSPRRLVRLHLLLFDPVPGNQIVTAKMLDPLGVTTANHARDVTSCEGLLRRVLAVYPYEPLPAITFHAPLVPAYPATGCRVEEVVSLGCHQGAALCSPNRISCRLSYVMLRGFLTDACGVALRPCRPFDECLGATPASQLDVLETLRRAAVDDARRHGARGNHIFISRPAHGREPYVAVVRNSNGKYLNAFHRRLSLQVDALSRDDETASSSSSSSSSGGGSYLSPRTPPPPLCDDDDDASEVTGDDGPLYVLEVLR
mmetsp:Transcript_12767/g.51254  ORF Transcript_12767/g.51254 Transcript_12767/m.51254 type:complete len:338 (+) Transcript_12767:2-1015(+)